MGILLNFANFLFGSPRYEEEEEELSWRTFRVDPRVTRATFYMPSRSYVEQLQECYLQLLDEVAQRYPFNFDTLLEQVGGVQARAFELESQLGHARAENESLRRQISEALEWQGNVGRKNAVRTAYGYDPIAQTGQPKDGTKFISPTGRSKTENKMLAAAMKEYGFSINDISEELEVSESSINVYLSQIRKHYMIIDAYGKSAIQFDEEYDNKCWVLEDMFKGEPEAKEDSMEEPLPTTLTNDQRGVIVRNVRNPLITG